MALIAAASDFKSSVIAYPLDHYMLDYEDIAVDLNAGRAMTKTGRSVRLAYCISPRVVVIAFVGGSGPGGFA